MFGSVKLAIGFLAYGHATSGYLPAFLKSLRLAVQESGVTARFWCWDNQPSNQANQSFLLDYPEIEYLAGTDNLGFGKAYNHLLRAAIGWGADYFLVVNPDTVWDVAAVRHLLTAMELDETLGSAAPKSLVWDFATNRLTKRLDSCGILKLPGNRFVDAGQGEIDRGQWDNVKIIGPSGCAGLYRLSALRQIMVNDSVFDELFFMYKEDCDLAMRLHLRGWSTVLVPQAKIWHDRSAAGYGAGLLARWRAQLRKNAAVKLWSRRHQLILDWKYWRYESLVGLLRLIARQILEVVYCVIFDRRSLTAWSWLWRQRRLINIPKKK